MGKIPREVRKGVYYVGKDGSGNVGSNVYFYTKGTMGTAGEKKGHVNFLGQIRTGRIGNPNGIMSVDYAIRPSTYLPKPVRDAIRKVIVILRKKK